jgi:4-amino-4-deoxy-L-arabinose transferase-like glycosyltransferase
MASGPAHNRRDTASLLAIAAAIGLLHVATNGRYGIHRDELQVLSDARHLDWGFVAYPPLVPALERLSLQLFGLWLDGLRLFSVLAQCIAIVVAGLMAREFGGGSLAQIAAASSVALTRFTLFQGTQFEYSSFDFLWWVLATWFLVRLLHSGNPRWWIAVAAVLGLGLQTKYTIVFLIAGIGTGLPLTDGRRMLRARWFWMAAALTC